jgi:hypothetical protein
MIVIASAVLGLLGLSQLYATARWQAYYRWLAAQGTLGVRLNGLVSLTLGAPIVAFHNVWTGPPLLLTAVGWLLLLESLLCLVVPRAGLAGLLEIEDSARGRVIRGTGVALLVIGGVLAIHAFRVGG